MSPWPRYPALYEINTWVWLSELSLKSGTAVDLHLMSGQTHAFAMLPSVVPHVQAIAAAFLDKHLVDPQFYVRENLELNQFAGGKRP